LARLNHLGVMGKRASEAIEANARKDNESHQEEWVFVGGNGHPCAQSRLEMFWSVLIARLLVCAEKQGLRVAPGSIH
jgi:hypothetical protein